MREKPNSPDSKPARLTPEDQKETRKQTEKLLETVDSPEGVNNLIKHWQILLKNYGASAHRQRLEIEIDMAREKLASFAPKNPAAPDESGDVFEIPDRDNRPKDK